MQQKTALVTGATGGLGRALTDYLVERGWYVFAADFDRAALEKLESASNITPVFIDVTDTESVESALKAVAQNTDGLDAVINFAGILAVGSMIELDEAVMQRVFDVNVMGTFRVNQASFSLLKRRRGRIVNISSETGWQSGGPFNGAYASSKHAIEGYSDSLRRELSLLDMPVIKVQPGPFRTEMSGSIEANFEKARQNSREFPAVLGKMKPMAVKAGGNGADPKLLAAVIHEALTTAKPKAAYSVKADPQRSFLEWLPVRWADALIKKAIAVKPR